MIKKIFSNALQIFIKNHLPILFRNYVFQCPILWRACSWRIEYLCRVQELYVMFCFWLFLSVSQWVSRCVDVWLNRLRSFFLRFWWLYCLMPWSFLLWLSLWCLHLHFWMHCLFVFSLIRNLMFHWDLWNLLLISFLLIVSEEKKKWFFCFWNNQPFDNSDQFELIFRLWQTSFFLSM